MLDEKELEALIDIVNGTIDSLVKTFKYSEISEKEYLKEMDFWQNLNTKLRNMCFGSTNEENNTRG